MTYSRPVSPARAPAQSGRWLAVGSIAAGTFLLVTTEFLPIGLLSTLAADLHVSEGAAGLAVTAPGFVAAIAAPAAVLLAGSLDRRIVILLLTAAIILSNAISTIADSFALFLVGRLLLGLAVGGLWSFAVAVGRRLVPHSAGGRATSIISAGVSAGTVCSMPVGAVVGSWAGWRMPFEINAAAGIVILLAQFALLPVLRPDARIEIRQLVAFAAIPMARIGLIASAFVAGGHFIAYTFLEPYLRDGVGYHQGMVALALAAYAVAGIAGSFLGERLADWNIRRAFVVVSALLAGLIMTASFATAQPSAAFVLVIAWGALFGAVPVCVQIWMHTSSPSLYEAGSALMVSAFQIAIAIGAGIGGAVMDHGGVRPTFALAGVIAFVGAAVPLFSRRKVINAAEQPCKLENVR